MQPAQKPRVDTTAPSQADNATPKADAGKDSKTVYPLTPQVGRAV